ncbi:MAG: hypothetical protein JW712_11090 [Dehalococcoidales bacterium]|nr:hypothetical protein [Dehalococcoidales bacterium]
MKIKLLGAHNCETLDYRHTCMVIDDIIALDAGSLTANLTLEEQKRLEAVVISHRHYDHIRDISSLGNNLYHAGLSTDIYTTQDVTDVLNEHVFTSGIYYNLPEMPLDNPTFRMHVIEPLVDFDVCGYTFKAVPVHHLGFTVGYSVISPEGRKLFYTSDTGPGLMECWKNVTPDLLIIEVTESNENTETHKNGNHLTPELLEGELIDFYAVHKYMPDMVTVHMSPEMEDTIRQELAETADFIKCRITPGYEGMEIFV